MNIIKDNQYTIDQIKTCLLYKDYNRTIFYIDNLNEMDNIINFLNKINCIELGTDY